MAFFKKLTATYRNIQTRLAACHDTRTRLGIQIPDDHNMHRNISNFLTSSQNSFLKKAWSFVPFSHENSMKKFSAHVAKMEEIHIPEQFKNEIANNLRRFTDNNWMFDNNDRRLNEREFFQKCDALENLFLEGLSLNSPALAEKLQEIKDEYLPIRDQLRPDRPSTRQTEESVSERAPEERIANDEQFLREPAPERIAEENQEADDSESTLEIKPLYSKEMYDYHQATQSIFGKISSFIPGTSAYKAKENLSNAETTENDHEYTLLNDDDSEEDTTTKTAWDDMSYQSSKDLSMPNYEFNQSLLVGGDELEDNNSESSAPRMSMGAGGGGGGG